MSGFAADVAVSNLLLAKFPHVVQLVNILFPDIPDSSKTFIVSIPEGSIGV